MSIASNKMLRYRYIALTVIDSDGRFRCVVNLYDISGGKVGNYVKSMHHTTSNLTLYNALNVMSESGTTWATLVDNDRLLGILTMENMNMTYTEKLKRLRG